MQSPNINTKSPTLSQQPSEEAASYTRVSTGRQEQEETIESQTDEIQTQVAEGSNILRPENQFQDDGWSGEILARPGLDTMLEAAREGKFSVLYVYDRGRLARKHSYQE